MKEKKKKKTIRGFCGRSLLRAHQVRRTRRTAHETRMSEKKEVDLCAQPEDFFADFSFSYFAFVSWHVNWLNAPFRCEWGRNEKMAIIHFSLGFSLFFFLFFSVFFFLVCILFGSFGRRAHTLSFIILGNLFCVRKCSST